MKTTQKQRILDYIKAFGSITSWQAYSDLGITQLGARIDQLKKEGYQFVSDWENNTNRYGEPVRYVRYKLVEEVEQCS